MGRGKSDGARQMVADTDAVLPTNLIRSHASGIRLEGQIDQFEHRSQVRTGIVGSDFQIEMIRID